MSKRTPIDSAPNKEEGDEFVFNDDVIDVAEEKWWWVFQNPFGLVVVVALCIILSIGLWFVFQTPLSSVPEVSDGEGVRVIKASAERYKVAPSPEDSSTVDNQDKEVFKRLKPEKDAAVSEEGTKALKQDTEQPIEVHKLPDVKEEAPKPEPKVSETKEEKGSITISKDVVDEKASKKVVAEKPSQSPKQLSNGLFMIRVASFRKPETAERELSRVIALLPREYQSIGREVRRIDSDTGAFYLALMGSFGSLAEAKSVVALLKEKNCSVVIQKVKQK